MELKATHRIATKLLPETRELHTYQERPINQAVVTKFIELFSSFSPVVALKCDSLICRFLLDPQTFIDAAEELGNQKVILAVDKRTLEARNVITNHQNQNDDQVELININKYKVAESGYNIDDKQPDWDTADQLEGRIKIVDQDHIEDFYCFIYSLIYSLKYRIENHEDLWRKEKAIGKLEDFFFNRDFRIN